MVKERFRCPYCGKETHLYETYCSQCEHDLAKFRGKIDKKDDDMKCFIATAAYGTPFAKDIDILRKWRDRSLKPHFLGRLFVRAYYKVSPPVARFISKRNRLRRFVRLCLRPIVDFLRHFL